jgi:putative membrane protein
MNYLLLTLPVYTWSLFFGLIAASILVVAARIDNWRTATWAMLAAGLAAAHLVVNLIPVATPETPAFIFFSGLVAICAMILPGLSGAFILLILGKYAYITGCLKNPFLLDNMVTILIFCTGCVCGLTGFSRFLHYLMEHYRQLTLAFLVGLMAGSLQKIWPWKAVAAVKTIRGKEHIIWGGPAWPSAVDGEVALAVVMMMIGFLLVFLLERLTIRGGAPRDT